MSRESIYACVMDQSALSGVLTCHSEGVPTYGTCVESTLILAFTWAAAGNCAFSTIQVPSIRSWLCSHDL